MIINKYLLSKLITSIFIALITIFSIFFIFSLLGNLGEKFSFSIILFLSFISSVQILFYIPIFIYFIIIMIFTILLKSKNELLIIMHYLPKKKLILIFTLLILSGSILESKKNLITEKLEQVKLNSISKNFKQIKIVIDKNDLNKEYTIIRNSQIQSNKIESINIYKIEDGNLNDVFYSEEIINEDKNIIFRNYYRLFKNSINFLNQELIIKNKFTDSDETIIHLNKKNYLISYKDLLILLNSSLTLFVISSFFFQTINILNKSNKKNIYFFSILIIFYNYLIVNIDLTYMNNIFNLFGILLMLLIIFKIKVYD